ncbi:uncharacterized transmembrane protein DDB_G0289901-like [Hetaerina americana]|uniref:uncharacterized transmembrane protein DDB_G0289901-like n=1 Tax=Hetaerina americana TaxID=62018 RepID=UPI003A7F45CD
MAAFSDWPGRGGGHWLPAYGFTQHLTHQNHGFIEDDDDEESIVVAESACFAEPLLESASSHDVTNLGSAVGGGSGNFLFVLETIVEETTDQLNGDASPRRPASAASSGEHGKKDVPSLSVFDDDNSCDPEADGNRSVSRGSDGEVPKKRRRKDPSSFLDTTVTSGDLSDEEELGSISRSSSLLQFESLERQLENELVPFRTTASSDPFGPPQSPVSPPLSSPSTSSSSSSSSGDDEEEEDGNSDNSSSDTLTGDSFPPVPAVPYSSSSSSSPPSSDSPTANRPRVNRLRSYRSFDSLNLMGARGDDQKDRGGEGFPSTAPWKGGWNHGHNRSLRHMSDRQIYSGRSLNAFRMEPETHEDGFDRGFGSDFRPPPERFGSWSERGNDFFFGEFGGVPEDSGGEMACDEEYGDDFWGDETPTERSFNEDAVARIDEESSEGVTKSMAVDVDSGFASSESPKSTRAGGNRKTSPKTCTREGSNASRRDGDGAVSSLDALGSWQAEEESASKALLLVYSGKVSSVDFDGGATEKSASENGRGGDGNVSLAGGEGTYAYVTEEVKEVSEGETGEDMWKRSGKGSSEKDVEGKENVLGMVGGAEEKGRREVGGCWEVRVERGVVGVVRGSEGRRHNVVERSGANGKAPEELLPLNGRVPEAKGGSLIASERAQVVNPLFAIGDVRDVGYHLGAGSCAGVGAGAWVAEGGQRHASPRGGSTEGGKGLEEEEEEGGRPQRGERSAVRAEAVSEEERGEIPKEVAEESASGERSRVQAGGVVGANDLDSREGKATPPIPTSARQSPALRDSVGSPFVAGIGSGDRVVEGEASREAIARTAAGKEEAAPSSSSSEGTAAVISSSSSSDGEGAEPVKGRSGAEGSSDGEEGLRKQLLVRGSADGEEDHRHGGAESVTAREEVSPGGRGVEEAGGQSGKGSRAGAASGAVSALGRGSAGPVGGVEARVKEGRKGGGVSGSGRGEEAKTEIAVRESEDRSLGETKGGRDEEEEVGSASGHRPFVGGEGGRLKGGGKGVSGGLEKGGHHRSPRLHFFGGAGRHGAHSSSAGRLDAAEAAEIRRRKKFGNAASDYWRGESAVEGFYNGRSRSEGGIGVEGKGRSASEEEEDDYDDEEVGGEEGQGWCIPEGSGRSKGRSASWTESGSSGADGRGTPVIGEGEQRWEAAPRPAALQGRR